MPSLIDAEPSSYEEAASEQVWHNAMVKYNSIMKKDVLEIVLVTMGKSMIVSIQG